MRERARMTGQEVAAAAPQGDLLMRDADSLLKEADALLSRELDESLCECGERDTEEGVRRPRDRDGVTAPVLLR